MPSPFSSGRVKPGPETTPEPRPWQASGAQLAKADSSGAAAPATSGCVRRRRSCSRSGLIYINSTNHPLQKPIIDLAVQHIEALESNGVFWFGWMDVLLLTPVRHRFFYRPARLSSCNSQGFCQCLPVLPQHFACPRCVASPPPMALPCSSAEDLPTNQQYAHSAVRIPNTQTGWTTADRP